MSEISETQDTTNINAPGDTGLNDAVADFIGEIEKEFAASAVDDQLAAIPPAQSAEAPKDGAAEAPLETPAAVATPDPVKVQVDAGLERLVAREAEVRAREEAFSKRENDHRALEARARELEARQIPDNFMDKLRHTPSDALKALGLDPEDLVRTVIAEKMGDKAPETLRAAIRETKTQAQIRALEDKIIAQNREAAQREFFDKVNAGARSYVTGGVGKDVPTVAEVAKVAPDRVHQEIMQEIIADAQVRSAREPNGELLTYADAAKRVEARWDAFKKLLVPVPAPSPASTSTDSKTTVLGTVPTKSPSPATKPPDRPLAPWLQKSDDAEEGIRAALMEYKRVESGKNQ